LQAVSRGIRGQDSGIRETAAFIRCHSTSDAFYSSLTPES